MFAMIRMLSSNAHRHFYSPGTVAPVISCPWISCWSVTTLFSDHPLSGSRTVFILQCSTSTIANGTWLYMPHYIAGLVIFQMVLRKLFRHSTLYQKGLEKKWGKCKRQVWCTSGCGRQSLHCLLHLNLIKLFKQLPFFQHYLQETKVPVIHVALLYWAECLKLNW